MRLRYFQTYDANGVDNELCLQFWDADAQEWVDINTIRVSEKDAFLYQSEIDY